MEGVWRAGGGRGCWAAREGLPDLSDWRECTVGEGGGERAFQAEATARNCSVDPLYFLGGKCIYPKT